MNGDNPPSAPAVRPRRRLNSQQNGSAPTQDSNADGNKQKEDHAAVKITVGNMEQSLAVSCPVQQSVVDSLINRGEIAMLAARPNTGKIPFIAQLVSAVASGTPFLGLATTPCRVLLIDVESQPQDYRTILARQWDALGLDASRVARSVDMFVRGVPDDPNSRELERILGQKNEVRWQWIQNLVEQGQYGLVVVDTMLTFSPFKSGDETRVRELFASLLKLCRQGLSPAFLGSVHLRKRDRKARIPTLLEDPTGWTEEILGTVVWSASADVRLGLERVEDQGVAFAGYQRGRGEFPPVIIQERRDDDGKALVWDRCVNDALAEQLLTEKQWDYFKKVPIGEDLTWERLREQSGAPKASLSRIKDIAVRAGLLEYDVARGRYKRLR